MILNIATENSNQFWVRKNVIYQSIIYLTKSIPDQLTLEEPIKVNIDKSSSAESDEHALLRQTLAEAEKDLAEATLSLEVEELEIEDSLQSQHSESTDITLSKVKATST